MKLCGNCIIHLDNRSKITPICDVCRDFVYQKTQSEGTSTFWKKCRMGRITGGMCAQVIPLAYDLVNKKPRRLEKKCEQWAHSFLSIPQDISGVEAVAWGLAHEKCAIDAYADIHKKHVVKCGLLMDPEGIFAGTIDGFSTDIYTDEKGQRLNYILEVKCPYSVRAFENIFKAIHTMRGNFYLKIIRKFKDKRKKIIVLDRDHRQGKQYYYQMQLYMYLHKVDLAHLFVWTPFWHQLIEVPYDTSFVSQIKAMTKLWQKYIGPQLQQGQGDIQSSGGACAHNGVTQGDTGSGGEREQHEVTDRDNCVS